MDVRSQPINFYGKTLVPAAGDRFLTCSERFSAARISPYRRTDRIPFRPGWRRSCLPTEEAYYQPLHLAVQGVRRKGEPPFAQRIQRTPVERRVNDLLGCIRFRACRTPTVQRVVHELNSYSTGGKPEESCAAESRAATETACACLAYLCRLKAWCQARGCRLYTWI